MTIPHLHPLWSERLRTTTGCGVFFHACIADIRSGSGYQSAPTLNAVRKLARAQYPWAILFLANSLVQLPNFLAAWVNGYREIGFLAEVPITLHDRASLSSPSLACSVPPSTIQFDLLVFPWRGLFSRVDPLFPPSCHPKNSTFDFAFYSSLGRSDTTPLKSTIVVFLLITSRVVLRNGVQRETDAQWTKTI